MKIVLISNLYEPYNRGGAEVIVKRTAKELLKQGHEVTIITAKPYNGLSSFTAEITEEESMKMIRFFPFNLFFYADDHKWPVMVRVAWHVLDLLNFHAAWTVKQMLEVEKPDLVITHNLMGLGYFIPRAIKDLSIKHIHVLHDIQLAVRSGVMIQGEEIGFGKTGFFASAYQSFVKWIFQSPSVIVSPSNYLLNFYLSKNYFPDSKWINLRNPIDQSFFSDLNKESDPNKDTIHFGVVGQLVEHKGLMVLKKAFLQIPNTNISLNIVGDGPMKAEMADWENEDERVDYKGRIPNEELPKFYQSMDMIILPTLTYENSPTVVYESLASGTPVIASGIGGAGELINDMENGIKVKAGDSEALKAAIQLFIENKPDMKKSAQESVADYKVEGYVKRLLEL